MEHVYQTYLKIDVTFAEKVMPFVSKMKIILVCITTL